MNFEFNSSLKPIVCFSLLELSSQVFRCHSGTYFENAMTVHDYLKASNKVIWQGI